NCRVLHTNFGKHAEKRDRDDRDRNRRADRDADFEHQIKRRSAENHSQKSSDQYRAQRKLPKMRLRADVRMIMSRFVASSGRHAQSVPLFGLAFGRNTIGPPQYSKPLGSNMEFSVAQSQN